MSGDLESSFLSGRTIILLALMLFLPVIPLSSTGSESVQAFQDIIQVYTQKGTMSLSEVDESFVRYGDGTGKEYILVQFDGPITDQMKSSLGRRGLTILDYIPDYTFVVKLNGADPSILEEIDNVNGWIPFPDEMKVSPTLYDMLREGTVDPSFEFIVIDTFVPSDDVEINLRSISDDVQMVTDTRYFIEPTEVSLIEIAKMQDVKWIEPRSKMVLFNDVASGVLEVNTIRTAYGLDGTGQIVAIADSGIDTGVDNHSVNGDVHLDFDNRLTIRDWSGDGPQDDHGHGTHVTGSVAGDGSRSGGSIKGMAPNASIVFQALGVGSSGSLYTPGNISRLFEQAYDLGARVHTNSWGSDSVALYGVYTTDSYQADWSQFHYPDQLILFAAGNDGADSVSPFGKIDPGQVSPPSTAKSIVTVGASENNRPAFGSTWLSFGFGNNPIRNDRVANNAFGLAAFSSRGPTSDDRLKPDVVAPGTFILSTKSSIGASGGWSSYDSYYHYNGGTSMSTPITAGTATVVRQFYNGTMGLDYPLNSLIKATLINGAVDMTPGQYGTGTAQEVARRPDIDQGWGRVDLKESLYPTGNFDFENNVAGLGTGENFTKVFKVHSADELRVTLAWSDFPGSMFAGKYLVNDLDLILTAPNGTVYHGNDLAAPFDDTTDDINPVEGISIPSPAVGWWELRVNATNVPKGPQHFAVVLSGNTTDLITNSMIFDRQYYSIDNSELTLRLTVLDLIGYGTMQVNLTSTSDPVGRKMDLQEEGEYGSFVGTIRSWNTSTADPGRIFVSPGDTIYAWFSHTAAGTLYEASATARKPQRIALWRLPENHMIYSEGDMITLQGNGSIGANAFWSVQGSSLDWMPLHDDGILVNADEIADDGLYGSKYLVPADIHVYGMLMVRVYDPYLGMIEYPQFPFQINTSMPRAPRDLVAEALPQGNSIALGWKRSSEPDMEFHAVYMNVTPLNLTYDKDGWVHLFNTTDRGNVTVVNDLDDGVKYYFRMATVNTTGLLSSLSPWAFCIPSDSFAPRVRLDIDPHVIAGTVNLSFTADEDLELLEVEYYNDTDGDGTANDGKEWMSAGSSTGPVLVWNTREEAGGPGNLEHMILRARGTDEMINIGNWREFPGFSTDNIGPLDLHLDDIPERISSIGSYSNLLGYAEPLSTVLIHVNDGYQNSTLAGATGIFSIDLELEEGYNIVNLTGYDKHGAGPVIVGYELTLDTMLPSPRVVPFNETMEISSEGVLFRSNSSDTGLDVEYTVISNMTWEVVLPTGEVRRGFGDSYHLDMDNIGNHVLNLTVEDMAGNINSTMIPFILRDTKSPEPAVLGPLIVNEDTSIRYSSHGTTDNDPLLIESRDTLYNWTFSGNEWNYTSERNETTVIFPEPGMYTGRLRVTDRSGNRGNATIEIRVIDITPPTGSISAKRWAYANDPVYFNTTFVDNDIGVFANATYAWELWFKDEYGKTFDLGSRNGSSLQMTFEDVGNFTLVLNVTDPAGNSVFEEHTIWIKDRPFVPEEEGLTPEERSWTLIVIIVAVIALLLVGALIFIRIITKEDIKDVDWADEEDLDDYDDEDEEEIELEWDE
ncbi:MAG: S8 family serine peptidase [Candidatus Thermoplasmatota archaeon]|nr:S8 family serine peptidase [Candidatus Thermoplasmatota archaeon]